MARVITPAVLIEERVWVKHGCGAIVEFTMQDVQKHSGVREGDSLWCPACHCSPTIPIESLEWEGGINPCDEWEGSGGICKSCGVAAYRHPGAPTPARRGCYEFICKRSTGRGFGDATWCEFCCLPKRDHVESP